MPALRARRGVVGHLVGSKPEARGLLGGGLIQRRRGHRRPAARSRRAACSVANAVPGSIVSWYSDRWSAASASACRSSARHAASVLPRPRVDQVERHARKNPPRHLQRRHRLSHRVLPPQHPQRHRIEALHAQRHPVHPGRTERRQPAGLDAGRVGLQRDLDARAPASNSRARILDQRGHRLRLPSGWACRRRRRSTPGGAARAAPPPTPAPGAAPRQTAPAGCVRAHAS